MWIKEVRGEEKRKGQVREEKRKGPASQKVGMAAGLEGLHRGRGSGCDHPGEFHFSRARYITRLPSAMISLAVQQLSANPKNLHFPMAPTNFRLRLSPSIDPSGRGCRTAAAGAIATHGRGATGGARELALLRRRQRWPGSGAPHGPTGCWRCDEMW